MGNGGPPHRRLERIRAEYPIALHSTGLSIGAHHPPDRDHLTRLRRLIDHHRPSLFSVPLAWSAHEGALSHRRAATPLQHRIADLRMPQCRSDAAWARTCRFCWKIPPRTCFSMKRSCAKVPSCARSSSETGCGLAPRRRPMSSSRRSISVASRWSWSTRFRSTPLSFSIWRAFPKTPTTPAPGCWSSTTQSRSPESIWAIYRRILGRTGPLPTAIERHWDSSSVADLAAEAVIAKQALRRARRQSMNLSQPQIGTAP